MESDERLMKQVHRLARKGLGSTSPNPAVGALVVKDRHIIGAGYHRKAGKPHAEIEALSEAGEGARGATHWMPIPRVPHPGPPSPKCA